MWSRSNLLLWVSIKKGSHKNFRLPIPFPLFVVSEIFESFLEMMVIIHLFTGKKSYELVTIRSTSHHSLSMNQINEVLVLFNELIYSLRDCEPFDLVNVMTSDVEVIVRIK